MLTDNTLNLTSENTPNNENNDDDDSDSKFKGSSSISGGSWNV